MDNNNNNNNIPHITPTQYDYGHRTTLPPPANLYHHTSDASVPVHYNTSTDQRILNSTEEERQQQQQQQNTIETIPHTIDRIGYDEREMR